MADIQIKTELTQLRASQRKLKPWSVVETEGPPIFKPPEGAKGPLTRDTYRVTDPKGLQTGDRIFVPMLVGYEWSTVQVSPDGEVQAGNETHGHLLKFSEGDPGGACWVVVGSYNRKGLNKLIGTIRK